MKTTDKIKKNLCWSLLVLFLLLGMIACSDDDDEVRIYSVWSNMLNEETKQINSVYTGTWIRLDGSGFCDLQAIYCNGLRVTEYNSTYMSDSHLTFRVPTNVPMAYEIEDESVRNTIRILTSHGEGVYFNFIFKDANKKPIVTDVSYTLPHPGDVITVMGKFLNATSAIYFPGNDGNEVQVPYVEGCADLVISDDGTQMMVKVPEGVGEQSGSLRIEMAEMGENYYTPNYMFYDKGMFIHEYDGTDALNYGVSAGSVPSNCVYHLVDAEDAPEIPAGARAYVFSIPEAPAVFPVVLDYNTVLGFFRFNTGKQLEYLIGQSNGELARETDARKVALQADIYMNHDWSTGIVGWRMNKNTGKINSENAWNVASWTNDNSYKFNGSWKTLTFPIHVKFATLGEAIDAWCADSGTHSLFTILNFDVLSAGLTMKEVTDFQMFVTNLRLVPYVTPEQ
ncbi:glycan-binding surface protein [uncultured Bacteroides sp.]|uniref:glycan-binding surface protein n=1 Tax=uncultured Bacteroides sp. TaxID=162156 RepID=UPI00258887D2|nr:glycan-binding surface protein [uncultured Bacteroides sp.]